MVKRRATKQIQVGNVKIGSGAPIAIQSMAKTDTRDVKNTVRQIKELEKAGCEIVRVAVKDADAAKAIKHIKSGIKIPLVADIHFDYKLALLAIQNGADKIRLNPGNISCSIELEAIIKAAKAKHIPIRIGVNSGSLYHSLRSGTGQAINISPLPYGERGRVRGLNSNTTPSSSSSPHRGEEELKKNPSLTNSLPSAMVKAVLDYIKFFEKERFRDIVISLKASNVPDTIEAYRLISKSCDYPLHAGVTAAGLPDDAVIRSAVGIGALLVDGIGDTIRVSLTGDPVCEIAAAKKILEASGRRNFGPQIISCPTCGRCQVDLVKIVEEFKEKIFEPRTPNPDTRTIKIAIMGCEVNGPGEAKDADIGIAAGKESGMLFKKGKAVKKVAEKDFVRILLEEIRKI